MDHSLHKETEKKFKKEKKELNKRLYEYKKYAGSISKDMKLLDKFLNNHAKYPDEISFEIKKNIDLCRILLRNHYFKIVHELEHLEWYIQKNY